MKDLMLLANECMREFDNLGIKYNPITNWTINSKAKSRWGKCERRRSDNVYSIEISSRLLQDDVPVKSVKQTICHELAHAVDGCMNHGAKWKNIVAQLNNAYGYNITRTNSSASLGITEDMTIYKYQFKCTNCGSMVYRTRQSDFVRRYTLYGCGRCHKIGTFIVDKTYN